MPGARAVYGAWRAFSATRVPLAQVGSQSKTRTHGFHTVPTDHRRLGTPELGGRQLRTSHSQNSAATAVRCKQIARRLGAKTGPKWRPMGMFPRGLTFCLHIYWYVGRTSTVHHKERFPNASAHFLSWKIRQHSPKRALKPILNSHSNGI